MAQIILIGLGLGAASALLYASPLSANPLSLAFLFFTTLPVLVAGLIWGHRLALLAVATAAIAIMVTIGSIGAAGYVIAFGAPAYLLAYLSMLGRSTENGIEWYPPGRIIFWAALIGAGIAVIIVLLFGSDLPGYRAAFRALLESGLKREAPELIEKQLKEIGLKSLDDFYYLASLVMPPWTALVSMTSNLFNLWLAGWIARSWGRLARPWPHLPSMTFPVASSVAFAASLAIAFFVPGLPGLLSAIFVAVFTSAHSLLGFAVLHSITQGVAGRPLLLAIAWASLVIGWPMLFAAALGIADQIFNLRGRFAARQPPMPPRQTR